MLCRARAEPDPARGLARPDPTRVKIFGLRAFGPARVWKTLCTRKIQNFWHQKIFFSKLILSVFEEKLVNKKFELDFWRQYIKVGPDFFQNFEPKSGWPDSTRGSKTAGPTRPELEIFRLDTAL